MLNKLVNSGLPPDAMSKSGLPEVGSMALFVPALIGGFELSHGLQGEACGLVRLVGGSRLCMGCEA